MWENSKARNGSSSSLDSKIINKNNPHVAAVSLGCKRPSRGLDYLKSTVEQDPKTIKANINGPLGQVEL